MQNHSLALAYQPIQPPFVALQSAACSDEALVDHIHEGDPGAELQLVKRFHGSIKNLARQMGADLDLSEDLAQETLLKVILNLRDGRLEDASRLAAYINQTARFTYYGWRRNKNSQLEFRESCDEAKHEKDLEQTILEANEQLWLCSQIQKLNMPRDRQLLLRVYFDHQDKRAVCTEMDLSPDQFDKLICRARKRLQKVIHA
jgi:RNA polymerase sigma factor (sigma-70 family)